MKKLRERAAILKSDIPALFLALKKKETPIAAKIFAFLTVAYALSPIDLIPDFIPVLGYLDDLLILPALATLTIKCMPREIMDACREESAGMWENGKPKRWVYAIPIVLFWILLLLILIKILFF